MAQHTEERLFLFGAPFAFFDLYSDDERDLSRLMMQQFGKFFRSQTVDWNFNPEHGMFSINGLENARIKLFSDRSEEFSKKENRSNRK